MSVSRTYTVWCDGTDGLGVHHAAGCSLYSGAAETPDQARSSSWFTRVGRLDFSAQCLPHYRQRVRDARRAARDGYSPVAQPL